MNSETGLIQLFSQHFPIIYEYRQMFFFGVLATIGIAAIATFFGVILGLCNALIRVIKIEKGNAVTRGILWLLQQCSRLVVTFSGVLRYLYRFSCGISFGRRYWYTHSTAF